MTAPRDFPPSPEQLEQWRQNLVDACDCAYNPDEGGHEDSCWMARLAGFLEGKRLAAALALWEAVEWLHRTGTEIQAEQSRFSRPHDPGIGADLRWVYAGSQLAHLTLPEAVSALKAKLAGEEPSRG